jgi:quercetin dioxygenase-like cupin family protein
MTMSKMNLKLMLAGVLVGCALGVIAMKVAWATPPTGDAITSSLIAGPVELDSMDIKIKDRDSDYELELKTEGLSSARVVHFTVPPGADFGWHTHPGPVFVMVEAGILTYYDAHDTIHYEAGEGFVDEGGDHVHSARNDGDDDVEFVAFFLTPLGKPLRIDAPEPE